MFSVAPLVKTVKLSTYSKVFSLSFFNSSMVLFRLTFSDSHFSFSIKHFVKLFLTATNSSLVFLCCDSRAAYSFLDTHELKSEGFEYIGNFSEGDFHGNGKLTYEFKNEVIEGEWYYGDIWNGKTKDKSGKILCKWVEGEEQK